MGKIPASIEETVQRFLDAARRQYKVNKVYLYGSQARGTALSWSDIDIAIISSDFSADLFEERLKLMHIAARIDDRIEPHPIAEAMFTGDDPLSAEIQRNGIRLA